MRFVCSGRQCLREHRSNLLLGSCDVALPRSVLSGAGSFAPGGMTVIPAPFSYHRPNTLAEATALLAQYSEEARALAGGQSLIPMMKLRLAVPEHLVDLGGIAELKGIQHSGNTMVIGVMTTQHELVGSKTIADAIPIIREAALLVADPQVRYVGTLGGNVDSSPSCNRTKLNHLNSGYQCRSFERRWHLACSRD